MSEIKIAVLCLCLVTALSANPSKVTFLIKSSETSNGFLSTTLCVPEINYCSKPYLYKYAEDMVIDENGNPINIEQKSTDMIIEACMQTDAYADMQGTIIDCGKMQAAELTPIMGAFIKLFEGYAYETEKSPTTFDQIGFTKMANSKFFYATAIQNGAMFSLKSDIHDCRKGSKWTLIGKISSKKIVWSLIEPNDTACKTFISDNARKLFNTKSSKDFQKEQVDMTDIEELVNEIKNSPEMDTLKKKEKENPEWAAFRHMGIQIHYYGFSMINCFSQNHIICPWKQNYNDDYSIIKPVEKNPSTIILQNKMNFGKCKALSEILIEPKIVSNNLFFYIKSKNADCLRILQKHTSDLLKEQFIYDIK